MNVNLSSCSLDGINGSYGIEGALTVFSRQLGYKDGRTPTSVGTSLLSVRRLLVGLGAEQTQFCTYSQAPILRSSNAATGCDCYSVMHPANVSTIKGGRETLVYAPASLFRQSINGRTYSSIRDHSP